MKLALVLLLVLAGCTHAPSPASEAPFPAITGHVFYRERVALDPNAQVELELADVSRADTPAVPVANQNIKVAGRSVPIAFDLRYDPAAIDRGHAYVVRARITLEGRMIWRGDPVPVLTHGAGDTAEILLRAAHD